MLLVLCWIESEVEETADKCCVALCQPRGRGGEEEEERACVVCCISCGVLSRKRIRGKG